ncbi:unnamed protein product [Acanthosepion pharaonis]|uniref:Uncharacterized protein n=1 Tax=Acanthosepion pharaonis TaxID=158019 RepID=A0A812ATA5_ACAPH|nr:unnamed protein product [Sepia pharaonis]
MSEVPVISSPPSTSQTLSQNSGTFCFSLYIFLSLAPFFIASFSLAISILSSLFTLLSASPLSFSLFSTNFPSFRILSFLTYLFFLFLSLSLSFSPLCFYFYIFLHLTLFIISFSLELSILFFLINPLSLSLSLRSLSLSPLISLILVTNLHHSIFPPHNSCSLLFSLFPSPFSFFFLAPSFLSLIFRLSLSYFFPLLHIDHFLLFFSLPPPLL